MHVLFGMTVQVVTWQLTTTARFLPYRTMLYQLESCTKSNDKMEQQLLHRMGRTEMEKCENNVWRTRVCMYVYMHVSMCMYIYLYVIYVCMYVCVYIYCGINEESSHVPGEEQVLLSVYNTSLVCTSVRIPAQLTVFLGILCANSPQFFNPAF